MNIYTWGFAYKLRNKRHVSSSVTITCPHTIGLNYNLTPLNALNNEVYLKFSPVLPNGWWQNTLKKGYGTAAIPCNSLLMIIIPYRVFFICPHAQRSWEHYRTGDLHLLGISSLSPAVQLALLHRWAFKCWPPDSNHRHLLKIFLNTTQSLFWNISIFLFEYHL